MIKVRHVGIVVRDIERSIDFYTKVLGFDIKKDQVEEGEYIDTFLGVENVKVRTVKMALQDNSMLELLQFITHPEDNEAAFITKVGCSHVALTVPDADSLYKKLTLENIKTINKPTLSPDGSAKVFFCKDPDGTWFEMVEEVK